MMIRGVQLERRNSTFFGSPKPKSGTSNPPARHPIRRSTVDVHPEIFGTLISGNTDYDLPTRVAKIREIIDLVPVEDVQAVLDLCEKLICDDDIDTANLGYTVVAQLAKYEELTPLHRVTFFTNYVRRNTTVYYNLNRSYLLSCLTDQGRNIEGFESYLSKLIPGLYEESSTDSTDRDHYIIKARTLGVNIPDSLDVLSNLIKFNARLISDDDIRCLLEQMLLDNSRSDSQKSTKTIAIVDNLIAYASIPKDSVRTVSSLISVWVGSAYVGSKRHDLSSEYRMDQDERMEKSWMTFERLLSTHLRDLAIYGLLQSLHDESESNQQARGAAMLIHRSLTDATTRKTVNLDLTELLEVLATEVPGPDSIAHSCIRLKLIRDLLGDEELQRAFAAELDWTTLHKAIAVNTTTPLLTAFDKDRHPNPEIACPDGDRVLERRSLTSSIIERLEKLPNTSLTQSRTLRKIALSSALLLNDRQTARLIEAYRPSAFRISVGNWLPEIKEIGEIFIKNGQAELRWRQRALRVVNESLQKAEELGEPEAVMICGTIMGEALAAEMNHTFRGNLVHCIISFVSEDVDKNEEAFQKIFETLLQSARIETESPQLDHHEGSEVQSADEENLPSMLPDAGLVALLMKSSVTHPQRARMIYREIIQLIKYRDTKREPEATVMLMRGLFRIRSDIDHHIFFAASPEGERLAETLGRNANEARMPDVRRSSVPFEQPIQPPAWIYDDANGLPQKPPPAIGSVLRSDASSKEEGEEDRYLDMTEWLRLIINIIEDGSDWEVYSYVIVHLAAQLSNQSLFTEAISEIRALASVICQKIQKQTVMKPPESSNLRQGDVAFCLIEILTTIIGYHWQFPRTETENMISTFIMGLTAWDITTVPCVHALTLCCYELPISLSRDLVRIVEKMSTIVTKSDAAIHVLEYLAGLSRLQELTGRFHGDEIKTVFGVCFSYIEYARGKRFDESQQRAGGRVSTAPTRQGSIASGQRPSTDDIPQYVFAISYHVITLWFLTLKAEDQKKYFPWMEQRLLSRDQAGNVEEEGLVTLDQMWRVIQGRSMDSILPSLTPAEPESKTWISEYCMLTISCQEGVAAEVMERRCSGTDFRQMSVNQALGTTPDDVFTQHSLSTAMDGPFTSVSPALPLPMTEATKRALSIFDRTSPVDFLKCGIIYVGESQTQESEILANVSGSPDYNLLVNGLGTRLRLAGYRGNVAGLDTSEGNFDGLITYQHSDGIITLNYHITTLMPTNRTHDPQCTRKKSHIGNDFVNIVFNNSGLLQGFDFNTFPSAFNYVYIVVTPEARQTFIQTRTRAHSSSADDSDKDDWFHKSWFRVQLMTREDFPDISSAAETKVVSGAALASYVRNLALNAEVFCRVWTNRGAGASREYPSSWRARLGQIRQLRERVEKMEREEKEKEKEKEG